MIKRKYNVIQLKWGHIRESLKHSILRIPTQGSLA